MTRDAAFAGVVLSAGLFLSFVVFPRHLIRLRHWILLKRAVPQETVDEKVWIFRRVGGTASALLFVAALFNWVN